jgi:hypothetical protein
MSEQEQKKRQSIFQEQTQRKEELPTQAPIDLPPHPEVTQKVVCFESLLADGAGPEQEYDVCAVCDSPSCGYPARKKVRVVAKPLFDFKRDVDQEQKIDIGEGLDQKTYLCVCGKRGKKGEICQPREEALK